MHQEHAASDDRDMTGRKKLLLELLVPLLLVVAVNVAFARWIDRNPSFPLPRILNSSIATGKYLAFVEVARSGEQVDILYTGLSPMMLLDAAAIDRLLAEPGHAPRGFNFSGPMHGPYFVRPFLERIAEPLTHPSLVIHGMMPLDIIFDRPVMGKADRLLLGLPAFSMHVDGFRGRFREFLLTRIPLIEYREVIVAQLWGTGPAKPDRWNELARETDPWGKVGVSGIRRATGIRPYERDYKKRLRKFQWKVRSTPAFERTIELAQWCEREGMDFVLVNTPVHPLFFELLPRGQEDYALFVEKLHHAAEAADVPIFDLLGAEPGPIEFFRDSHHFSTEGAAWFSAELTAFLRSRDLPRHRD